MSTRGIDKLVPRSDPGGSGGGGVNSVSGAGPITSTGGANPIIGITAATELAAGSMSAADKIKLDDALFNVQNIAALAAYDDTTLTVGDVVSMRSLLDFWSLENSGAVVDGITIIAANSGGAMRWHRALLSNGFWQEQPTWHINFAVGNDENVGATAGAGNALKTYDEYNRRVGGVPVVSQTVTFDVDYPLSVFAVNDSSPGSGFTLTLMGAETVLFTGVATTVTPTNAATPIQTTILSATIPVSWTASGLVNKTAIVTAGALAGYAFQVTADLGAKTARVTQASDAFGNTGELDNGNVFNVVSYASLNGVILATKGQGNIIIQQLRIVSNIFLRGSSIFMWACDATSGAAQNEFQTTGLCSISACRLNGTSPIVQSSSSTQITDCWLPQGMSIGGDQGQNMGTVVLMGAVFGAQLLAEQVRIALRGTIEPMAGASFFGVASPISLSRGAYLDMSHSGVGNAIPFGTGNTGTGISLSGLSSLEGTETAPNLVGVTDQLSIDGIKFPWTTLTAAGTIESGVGSVATVSNAGVDATHGINIMACAMAAAVYNGRLQL